MTTLPLSCPSELDGSSPKSLALDTSEISNTTGQEPQPRDAVSGTGCPSSVVLHRSETKGRFPLQSGVLHTEPF